VVLHRPDPVAGASGRPSQIARALSTQEVTMASPVLVAVYDDPDTLAALEQTLQTRFGPDYQILTAATPTAALKTLRQLRQDGDQVALVLADQWLAGMTGVELLCQAHELHPTAKRALFITYGDAAAGTAGLQAMALGQLDLYLNARAPHRLVGRLRRPGRAGFPAHRPRPAPQRQATPRLAPGPTTAAAGDQPARRLPRRRHPPRLGQTRRLGRRRRRHRHPTRPRIPSRTLGTYGRAELEPCGAWARNTHAGRIGQGKIRPPATTQIQQAVARLAQAV
jgi:CheY-like chemotaxis protein